MTNTQNKGYALQATGTNVGTWGTVLNNSVFSIIDNNLGGTLNISVAGNSNIDLTASQASYLIHNLTGTLTGDIDYIFPAAGGFYAVNNGTSGAYTVTVKVVGGSGGIMVPQGQAATIYIDATVPQVESFIGTQYQFIAGTVGGTANALTVSQTFPTNFSLIEGIEFTFTPTANNTGSATIAIDGGSPVTIQKVSYAGLVNLVAGDLVDGLPVVAQYNGSVFIGLNIPAVGYLKSVSTSQSVTFANNLTPYVNTSAVTYTIDQTANLLSYWFVDIDALGGAATITPYTTDVIHVNGAALSAGASLTMPQGSSCRILTDANGNLYIINYTGAIPSNATATTQSAANNSTKIATTAYADAAATTAAATVKLGAWDATKTANNTYQAATDGFVVVNAALGGGGESQTAQIITDSASTPTTVRGSFGNNFGSDNWSGMMCSPVRKSDYWKVTTSGAFSTLAIFWLPLGT